MEWPDPGIAIADPSSDQGASRPGAVPAPPVGLYVHVPFCVALCPYCDFVVYTGAATRGPRARIGTFLEAVHRELDLRADALDAAFGRERPPLGSVYLGGGTPSLLGADDVLRLLDRIAARYGVAPGAEITIEANPGPDERGDAGALAAAGITRYSIGAQSFDDALLRALGRRHAATDIGAAVAAAREAGLRSVSLDLLYDVPDQGLGAWLDTLDAALALKPDHLSLYALTLDDPDAEGLTGPGGDHLPVRTGARRWREQARAAQDEDRAAAQYHAAAAILADEGFRGYEIANWAQPGHESRHNLAYWRRQSVEAVGPGAHGFDGVTRRWNAARLDAYVAALLPGSHRTAVLPPGGAETLDEATARAEALILGLRLDTGIPLADAFAPPLGDAFGPALAGGLLTVITVDGEDRVRLTTAGRLLSNELFAQLVP